MLEAIPDHDTKEQPPPSKFDGDGARQEGTEDLSLTDLLQKRKREGLDHGHTP